MRWMTTVVGWGALAGALVAPLGLACDPADDDSVVLGLIDDALRLENDAIAIVCDCWEELGESSRNACLDDQILPSQRRCIEDSYLRESAASKLYLECLVPLIGELNSCLDDKLACDDPGPTDACFDDFDLGLRECVALPNSVQRGLDECYAGGGIQGGGDSGPSAEGGAESPDPATTASGDDGPSTPDTATSGSEDPGECTGDVFVCGDGNCIPANWECDGTADCTDGEDEAQCGGSEGGEDEGTTAPACGDDDFICGDGSCIPPDWECDGSDDCADASDEADCGGSGPEEGGEPVPPGG